MIAAEMEKWEPQRSILREGMIRDASCAEARHPDDWFLKVPHFQRAGTNAIKGAIWSKSREIVDGWTMLTRSPYSGRMSRLRLPPQAPFRSQRGPRGDAGWEFMAHCLAQMPIQAIEEQRAMMLQSANII